MHVIGLCGFAGSGKDTVAKYLEENHNYYPQAFAEALKEVASALTNLPVNEFHDRQRKEEVIRDGFFQGLTRREVLIRLGISMRDEFGEDIWAHIGSSKAQSIVNWCNKDAHLVPGYVLTDVRFENEARLVIKKGGAVIRVTRPGHGSDLPGTELKDNELDDKWISVEIVNDGTLEQLERATTEALAATEKDEEGIQTIRASSYT